MNVSQGSVGGSAVLRTLFRRSDLPLAALVVATVALMIVPLPTWLLDVLLSLNLGLAVVLLGSSIYVAGVASVTTLPSILLLATLFRLALNVSSTRLILVQADAGSVIESFGSFVVAGNTIVGAVVFLILTVIQFVVIAKGGERIAEVAARFSLDAMPGRQLAIDADLRAGILSAEAAGARRLALQQESQLYGAMDGAMKFVKGDAIAGLVITGINIVGGLIIGVWQHGMTLADAAETYTLLTVGDGLVSQIPALIIATSAGIVVTRVGGHDGGHLGGDIARQILHRPRALSVAAALFVVLALTPGLPLVPFLLMAALAGAGAALAWREQDPTDSTLHPTGGARMLVCVGPDHAPEAVLDGVRAALARVEATWGVNVGHPHVQRGHRPGVSLVVRDVPVPLALAAAAPAEAVTAAAQAVVEANLPDLLGLQEVRELLDRERLTRPATVEAALSQTSVGQVRAVLTNLVQEGVPVRSVETILETLAERVEGDDVSSLTEKTRRALRRQITHRYAPEGTLQPLLVEREIEDMFAARCRKPGAIHPVTLPSDLQAEVETAVSKAAGGVEGAVVILTRPDIRQAIAFTVRRALAGRQVATLAVDELEPNVRVEPCGTICVRSS